MPKLRLPPDPIEMNMIPSMLIEAPDQYHFPVRSWKNNFPNNPIKTGEVETSRLATPALTVCSPKFNAV